MATETANSHASTQRGGYSNSQTAVSHEGTKVAENSQEKVGQLYFASAYSNAAVSAFGCEILRDLRAFV